MRLLELITSGIYGFAFVRKASAPAFCHDLERSGVSWLQYVCRKDEEGSSVDALCVHEMYEGGLGQYNYQGCLCS